MGPSTGEPDPLPTIHSGSSVVVPLFLVEPSTYMRIKKTQVYHTYQIQLGMQVIDLPYNRRGPVRAVVAYPGSQTPFPSFPLVGRLPAGMPVGASRSRACRATAALPNSPSAVSDGRPTPPAHVHVLCSCLRACMEGCPPLGGRGRPWWW